MTENPIHRQKHIYSEVKVLLIIFVVCFIIFFRPTLKVADQVGYYSWVRSVVIDGDLNIKDEFDHYGMGNCAVTIGGVYPAQPWAIGCAILWLPFFLFAHLFVMLAASLGISLNPDGYSFTYRVMVCLGTTIYAFFGLLLTYKSLRLYFDAQIAQLALISVWLASPLIFYMYSHPMLAHANDMFGYALILFTWLWSRNSPHPLLAYPMLGCAAGLSALIRTQNALVAVLLVCFLLFRMAQGKLEIKNGILSILLFSFAWWITFSPQLYVWHLTFGEWLPGVPYSKVGGGEFYPGFPYVLQVLFSTNRGLFLWHPLLFFGFIGLFLLRKYDRSLLWFFLATFLLQLAIVSSWQYWDGAYAFGQRFFVNLSPAFMFGLAAFLNEFIKKFSFRILLCFCGTFILWNFLLILQYALGTLPRSGPVNLKTLVINQFFIVPTHLKRIIEAWIRRS